MEARAMGAPPVGGGGVLRSRPLLAEQVTAER